MKSRAVDFFVGVGQLKQHHEEFDIVVLDPPYFSITEKGEGGFWRLRAVA
jgi:23S rRNA G2069 N7-methylase RlmK/C1962 C5-methylase RlmI